MIYLRFLCLLSTSFAKSTDYYCGSMWVIFKIAEFFRNLFNTGYLTTEHTLSKGGQSMFFTPPLLSDLICKIVRPIFQKKARRRRKNFEVPFFKKLTFLGKFNGFQRFLTVFQRFSVPPRRKKPGAGEKFGNPFFCAPEARQKFSEDFFIFVRGPPKKFGDNI